jgi:hypothetical protein
MPKNCKLHSRKKSRALTPIPFKTTDSLHELSLQAIAQADRDHRFKEAIIWKWHPEILSNHFPGETLSDFKRWYRKDLNMWTREEVFQSSLRNFLRPFKECIHYSNECITFKGDWWNLPADINNSLSPPFSPEI